MIAFFGADFDTGQAAASQLAGVPYNRYGAQMKNVDLIIKAATVVTVDSGNRVLTDHSLVIDAGRIVEIAPHAQAEAAFTAAKTVDRSDHILMPGLVNSHCHMAMNLLRGYADDLALMTWLQDHIWPVESQWVSPEFVRCGSELAIAESLLGGVTCINDMYFFPDESAKVARQCGIRLHTGMIVLDFPTAWATNADEYLAKGLALHDELKHDELVNAVFAPHAPYTVSSEPLQRIATLSAELDIPIHMHVHETRAEVDNFQARRGKRPLQALHELGLLSPSLLAVHLTQLLDEEITLLANTGAHALHCPESNLKLASGACPVAQLLEQGVNVAVGTDGAASNNDLDMFGEMRTAALLAKHHSGNAAAVPAETALRMATINGARALGIQQHTGSLEAGKSADCIAVNTDTLNMLPLYNPVSHLVYNCDRTNVSDAWVNGQQLLADRQLQTLDASRLRAEAQQWCDRIRA